VRRHSPFRAGNKKIDGASFAINPYGLSRTVDCGGAGANPVSERNGFQSVHQRTDA
jgi:hypothetical protein